MSGGWEGWKLHRMNAMHRESSVSASSEARIQIYSHSQLRPLLPAPCSWQTPVPQLTQTFVSILFGTDGMQMLSQVSLSPPSNCLALGEISGSKSLFLWPYHGIYHILQHSWCESLPPSLGWELLESSRKPILSTLWPSWPHFRIR